jgi:hypothetical protein
LEKNQLRAQQAIELAQAHQKNFLTRRWGHESSKRVIWSWCMTAAMIGGLSKSSFQNRLAHTWSWRSFLTTRHELAHLDGEGYGRINHDKLKHFHTA